METDPKGQLGGLECNDSIRRTMAQQSRSWKCAACSKTNLEILIECEKEAAKLRPDVKKPDETVPSELKMGWRDEMQPATDAGPSNSAASNAEDNESAELAEGFVRTAPVDEPDAHLVLEAGESSVLAYVPAQPVQGVPQPTATIPFTPTQPQPQPQPQTQQQLQRGRQSNDGVPEWVDKAIIGIVACLMFMILKMLLRF